jgi:hypothetical protein
MKHLLAYSTAGHDTGWLYYVLESDERSLLLVNGKEHKLISPKRKNRKHVFVLEAESEYFASLVQGQKQLTDKGLRRELSRLNHLLQLGGNNGKRRYH